LTSCDADRFNVDVDEIDLDIPIRRLDLELFHLAPGDVASYHEQRFAAGDVFYTEFIEAILRAGPMDNDSITVPRLQRFLLDPNWNSAQASAEETFGDMSIQKAELEDAFKRYTTFFPKESVPNIVVFNSGFNYAIYPMDNTIGIGIEWFIGEDADIVKRLAPDRFPNFMKQRMRPEFIVNSTMTGWLFVHHRVDLTGKDVLTNMVHHGKVLFALDKILPEKPDSIMVGYTQAQLDWCKEHEFNIWTDLAGNDVLFSKTPREVNRIMSDGPFTNGFPRESPGRIGEWVGWQIVTAYMDDHEEMTIEQLFKEIDPQEIMKSYRPSKN